MTMLKKEWSIIIPTLALLALAAILATPSLAIFGAVFIIGAVIAAVHHAEVIALRVGEPLGSIILAVAVTIIETALIITLVSAGGKEASSLARDTVFSAVMIAGAGVIGLSILTAAIKHNTARFNPEGTASALATVVTLAVLTLILPNFTDSTPGPSYNTTQLICAAAASIVLYGLFIFIQTVRHRDYFLPEEADNVGLHAAAPSGRAVALSGIILPLSLIAVIGLTKFSAPPLEKLISDIGAPASAIGVLIALVVLLPETIAAVKNAAHGRMQTSFNLAYGSAIASIGLTIPAVALASIIFDLPLVLGLGPAQIVLLISVALIGSLTVLPGRATVQEGALHLILFGAFILLAFIP